VGKGRDRLGVVKDIVIAFTAIEWLVFSDVIRSNQSGRSRDISSLTSR
jgi:hypothetical protein